jgi:hypothetical protein
MLPVLALGFDYLYSGEEGAARLCGSVAAGESFHWTAGQYLTVTMQEEPIPQASQGLMD